MRPAGERGCGLSMLLFVLHGFPSASTSPASLSPHGRSASTLPALSPLPEPQHDFKPMVVAQQGFEYRPEKPDLPVIAWGCCRGSAVPTDRPIDAPSAPRGNAAPLFPFPSFPSCLQRMQEWVEQKWGWRADEPGAWAALQVDTQPSPAAAGGSDAGSSSVAGSSSSGSSKRKTQVQLAHLRSHTGMGTGGWLGVPAAGRKGQAGSVRGMQSASCLL